MRYLDGDKFHLRKPERGVMPILAAVAALAAVAFTLAGPAGAGRPIDPSILQPPPPPGAVCRADGPYVICDTFLDSSSENAPVFDLPCGTVYETSAGFLHERPEWNLKRRHGIVAEELPADSVDHQRARTQSVASGRP